MKALHTLCLCIALMIGLSAICSPAVAAPVTAQLSWDAPTTREDGTPLLASEIAGYEIYMAVTDGSGQVQLTKTADVSAGNATTVSLDLAPRPQPYVVHFAAATVDKRGLKSKLSATVSKTFDVQSTAGPAAPTSVQFDIDCTSGCVITVAD